jgi:lysophospholipase L1-like esterase
MIRLLVPFLIFAIMTPTMVNSQSPYRYLALGDSYTIGEDETYDQIFPKILIDHLSVTKLKSHSAISSKIIAKTGWTTKNLLDAMDTQLNEQSSYDLVTLLIGVNNQYQGKPIDQYEAEFETLLKRAIQLAQNKVKNVIVVSIPDYGVTPFGAKKDPAKIKKELDLYNKINKNFAKKYKVKYVDITPISRDAKKNISLLAKDQLHPSGKMYHLWVNKIIKVLP